MAKQEEIPKFEDTDPVFDETSPVNEEQQSLTDRVLNAGKNALQSGVQSVSDLGRGAVQGLSVGLSDEAIAALKASIPSDEEKGQDWKSLYRKYQAIEQAKNEEAKARSPWLYKGAEWGGLLAPALLTAGATAVPEAGAELTASILGKKALAGAATGAVQGGLMGASGSETGKLIGATPEEQQQLLSDVKSGAIGGSIIGGIATPAIPLIGNLGKTFLSNRKSSFGDYISDSPFWRQAGESKKLGEQGVNIYSEKAAQGPIGETSGLIHQDTNATRDLVDRIYKVDESLGQKVGDSINNATDQGVTVDLTDPMLNSVNTFKNLIEKDQNLAANPKAQKLYDTIFQMSDNGEFDASNLTPKEVQSLRQDVNEFSDSIKLKNPDIASLGYQFQGQIGDLLKQAVPEYKIASERFEQFRRLVPETIISGSTPVDISQIKLGNLKNDEAKLFSSTKNMLQGASMPGTGAANAKETYKNLVNGVNEFEQNEAERMASGEVPSNDDLPKLVDSTDKSQASSMKDLIQNKADQSALLQQAWKVNPQESAETSLKGSMFGRSSIMNMANKYGLYKDTLTKPIMAPVKLTQKIYNASEEELRGMAQKMSDIPGLQSVGKTLLQGLDNKDTAGVNAAIFSIMQNPQARILVNGENTDSEKKGQ